MHCAGWFDLYRVDRLLQGDVDHEGVTASKDYLNSLVEAELQAGMPPKRIVVGGFSQVKEVTPKEALFATQYGLSSS